MSFVSRIVYFCSRWIFTQSRSVETSDRTTTFEQQSEVTTRTSSTFPPPTRVACADRCDIFHTLSTQRAYNCYIFSNCFRITIFRNRSQLRRLKCYEAISSITLAKVLSDIISSANRLLSRSTLGSCSSLTSLFLLVLIENLPTDFPEFSETFSYLFGASLFPNKLSGHT